MTTTQRNIAIGISIVYGAKDELTPVQNKIKNQSKDTDNSLRKNVQSVHMLGRSLVVVGGGLWAFSAIMQRSNNEMVKNAGSALEMSATILIAAGSAISFIGVIGRLITSLKALRNAQLAAAAAGMLGGGGGIKGIAGKGIGAGGAATGALGLGSKAGPIGLLVGAFAAAAIGAGVLAQKGGPLDFASPMMKRFAGGGVVPGPIGAARSAIVHGGETITPAGRSVGGSSITLNVGTLMGNESDARRLAQLIGHFSRVEARRVEGGQRNR